MLTELRTAYQGRRVLVTGHTGFKGPWLVQWLKRLGARISGYALAPPTRPNNFELSRIESLLHGHHLHDVRDGAALQRVLGEFQPEFVFHLAAQTVVREGYVDPVETFDVNVMGTVAVLEAVRRLGLRTNVIVVTSDKCYENREQVWGYRECDAMGERDPYGGSKGAAELAVRSYRHSFFHPARVAEHGVRLASARAGNVIGGGDWTADALLTDLISALGEGRPIVLRNPDAYRPWQHVLQALSGYLVLGARLDRDDRGRFTSGWNFGPIPGNEIRVAEFVDRFCRSWGAGSWCDASDRDEPHEAQILRLNIDRAIWELGWKPCWSVDQTIQATVDWFRAFEQDPSGVRDVATAQITAYESAMDEATRQNAERSRLNQPVHPTIGPTDGMPRSAAVAAES